MDEVIERIRLDQARAGMVISVEVTDPQGRVLVPCGAVLSATQLALLRRHDIALLAIARQAHADGEEPGVAALRERVKWLFRKCDDNALMRRLARAVLDYRAGK